ncbi:MAG: hypothetical protein ACYC90_05340 [Candidatus Nanopelagicales bacterium]
MCRIRLREGALADGEHLRLCHLHLCHLHLCRLRHAGCAAMGGSAEDALGCARGLYLTDPSAWT